MFTESEKSSIPLYFVDKKNLSKVTKNRALSLEDSSFEAKLFQIYSHHSEKGKLEFVLVGTEGIDLDEKNTIRLGAFLQQSLVANKNYSVSSFDKISDYELYLGWGLGFYSFEEFKSKKQKAKSIRIVVKSKKLINELNNEIEAIFKARNLINSPSNYLTPTRFSQEVKEVAKKYKAKFSEVVGEDLVKKNFPMIYTVGKGSSEKPRLMEMKWGSGGKKIVIVGKAVCFDTGGYNLKPSGGIRNMKKDMGGGALALSLSEWLLKSKVKASIQLLIPCVENKISHNAFLPGDIHSTRKGLQIEIDNTDAEGRLILCDALTYAFESKPDIVIDFATLTGACRVALGPDLPAIFTDNEKWANSLVEISHKLKDPLWRLPLWEPYKNYLKSQPADMLNSANSPFAGAITAALYLKSFVSDSKKWVHIDTYCWSDEVKYGQMLGADTQGLRAAYGFLMNQI